MENSQVYIAIKFWKDYVKNMLFSYELLPILKGNNSYKNTWKIVILESSHKCPNGVLTA